MIDNDVSTYLCYLPYSIGLQYQVVGLGHDCRTDFPSVVNEGQIGRHSSTNEIGFQIYNKGRKKISRTASDLKATKGWPLRPENGQKLASIDGNFYTGHFQIFDR